METSVPGVYAIGDCVFGHAQLAHTASAMGEVAAENIMGIPAVYDERTNPTCVYIEPEAASVGLTEEQCKAQGIDYEVHKLSMRYAGRFVAENEGEDGICKILVGKQHRNLLGVHMLGNSSSEAIWGAALMIEQELRVKDVKEIIFPHPTVSEIIRETIWEFKD